MANATSPKTVVYKFSESLRVVKTRNGLRLEEYRKYTTSYVGDWHVLTLPQQYVAAIMGHVLAKQDMTAFTEALPTSKMVNEENV